MDSWTVWRNLDNAWKAGMFLSSLGDVVVVSAADVVDFLGVLLMILELLLLLLLLLLSIMGAKAIVHVTGAGDRSISAPYVGSHSATLKNLNTL